VFFKAFFAFLKTQKCVFKTHLDNCGGATHNRMIGSWQKSAKRKEFNQGETR
jgi:hypothetical protein